MPLKGQLFDSDDFLATDADVIPPPVIQVMLDSGPGAEPIDVTDDALPAGQGTDGNQFEFTTDDVWQFNLKTKNYTAEGTYNITVESGDTGEYNIIPICTATFVRE